MKTIMDMKNLDYVASEYLEKVKGPKYYEVAILEELDQQQWNSLAKRTNVKTFVKAHGRFPSNYEEVQSWMENLFPSIKMLSSLRGEAKNGNFSQV